MKVRRLVIGLLIAAGVYALLWLSFANPFNLFVPRSEHFSLRRFRTVGPGTSIADAIKLLGKPIKVENEDRFDPSCPACVAYCFMGDPPKWVIGFQEAWLVVDRKGQVVQAFINEEP